ASIALASEEHYKPQGPNDFVPSDRVSVAVALADKIDTLVGFWVIDEKPTGSKDPYALRRAALGVIRNLLENSIRLSFIKVAIGPLAKMIEQVAPSKNPKADLESLFGSLPSNAFLAELRRRVDHFDDDVQRYNAARALIAYYDLVSFIAERLK